MPAFHDGVMMDLLLWRHAEAEDGEDDLARELTVRGRRQAEKMAAWIRAHQPKDLRIIVSPSVRTCQTADALGLPYEIHRKLEPRGCVSELIAASGWPTARGAVLLVGHQPGLGNLASLLLGGHEAAWTIKKGALWWLTNRVRADENQTVLRAALTPDLL